MRTLCLIGGCPLPAADGDDARLIALLEVWASLGPVDVVVRGTSTEAQRTRLRDHLGAERVEALPESDVRAHGERLGWLRHRTVPLDIASLDPRPARQRMRRLAHQLDRADAVFASDPFMAWLLRPALWPVPWLVDVPVVHGPSPWSGRMARPRDLLRFVPSRDRSILELIAIDRAARFELHEAGIAHVATVRTSEAREALGSPTASVIPDDDIASRYTAVARAVVHAAGTYASKGWP